MKVSSQGTTPTLVRYLAMSASPRGTSEQVSQGLSEKQLIECYYTYRNELVANMEKVYPRVGKEHQNQSKQLKLQQQCQRSDSDNRVSIDAKCVNAEDGGTGDRVKVDKTVKANDRVKADDTVNAKHMVNTEEYAHFVAIQKQSVETQKEQIRKLKQKVSSPVDEMEGECVDNILQQVKCILNELIDLYLMDQLLARRTQFKCYDLLAKLIMAAKLPKEFSISKLDCCSDICHLQMKRIINAAVPEFTISQTSIVCRRFFGRHRLLNLDMFVDALAPQLNQREFETLCAGDQTAVRNAQALIRLMKVSVDMYYLELALAVLLADRNALDGFLKATTDEARLLPDRVQIFLDGYSQSKWRRLKIEVYLRSRIGKDLLAMNFQNWVDACRIAAVSEK